MSMAQMIADVAQSSMPDRIDNALADIKHGEWSDSSRGHDYVDVLRGFRFWAVDTNIVAGSAPDTPDGKIWGYVLGEVLDSASQDFNLPESACIDFVDETLFLLSW